MRILSKFFVLTWKNLLLKRRHWFMSILEIVVPVFLFAILAILRFVLELFAFYAFNYLITGL